ncbi:hypothetical protein A2704_03545 [Candidatus Kaiserbacteria bacterium RIFCSPHIGHO2_01_FULL_54_36b]|uniref:Orotate phosphoribosyltransferase n=1 Tax=Candidatus Kaiserbacteria bacterium RIFCSPHIGHO2_01_FULL_54_36b TaxID=1798483 RepID=A0A1F6CRR3_9BACT|nr:MAG: hypothetical protein A2704_03545 [Candidatus Kaiserbacteria bacterium RIFCSPHIGHO2_01_FULL_54_36b]
MDNSIAGVPLDAGAVTFDFDKGFDFVSGVHSPVYMDIRKIFYEPITREKIIIALKDLIERENIVCDIIAGVETGGIAPAALLASMLQKKFVYIRKKPKEHGLKRMIEGGEVAGKEVLLVEDTVSTGASSLSSIEALKDANALIKDCVAITSYDFPEAFASYEKANIILRTLVSAADIALVASKRGILSEKQENRFIAWTKNPYGTW